MTVFKHILVPTDFGEAAEGALDVAVTVASKFEARLTLLHVSWLPVTAYVAYGDELPWPTDAFAEQAEKELDARASAARSRYLNIDSRVVKGEAWEEILRAASEGAVDLIVMGTHGRRGLSRVFLGSVAEKIVRLAPIPVLTVPSKEEQRAREKVVAEGAHTAKK
jgi:nucleotide-binding universal stress UspA family protein